MKRVLDFNGFMNESVRDAMKPKSREEIESLMKDKHPTFVLWLASEHGYLDIVKDSIKELWKLKKEIPYMALGNIIDNAIDYAISGRHMDIVEYLDEIATNPELYESVRNMMTPKSDEDIIDTFNNTADEIRKKMIRTLVISKFKNDDEFFNFVKLTLGMDTFRRLTKHMPRRYAHVEDLINALRKHEAIRLFKPLLNKKNKVYESVRDAMKPKSDEDIRQAYMNLVKSLNNHSVDKFPDEFQGEFDKIADVLGVPKDSLYLIEQEGNDNYYVTFNDYFESIIDNKNKVTIKGIGNEDVPSLGDWVCYPKQKLAYYSGNDFDDPHAWVFPKNLFTDKLYESVRSLMKPRSKEEIDIAMKNMFLNHPVQFFIKFKYYYDDLKAIFTEEEIRQGIDKYASSLFLMMKGIKEETKEKQLEEFKEIVWYMFKEDYMFDNVDSLHDLWFKHKTKDGYSGGHHCVNGYETLKDTITYIERMKKPLKYI